MLSQLKTSSLSFQFSSNHVNNRQNEKHSHVLMQIRRRTAGDGKFALGQTLRGSVKRCKILHLFIPVGWPLK